MQLLLLRALLANNNPLGVLLSGLFFGGLTNSGNVMERVTEVLNIVTPILLAALGCLLCARAGITNLAIDGFITVGCFISIAVVNITGGNVWLGMLGGMIGTGVYSLIFGLSVIKFKSNHIITSIAMNLLSTGITEFLMAPVFKAQGLFRPSNIKKIDPIHFDFLENIPVLHVLVNDQSIVVLITIGLVLALWFVLKKTGYGLNVISVGQSLGAAQSAGVKPDRVRWSVVALSGVLCGLAGAYHPVGIALASLLFGFAESFSIQIELLKPGIATSLVSMIPYILALAVLTISALWDKVRRSGWMETVKLRRQMKRRN